MNGPAVAVAGTGARLQLIARFQRLVLVCNPNLYSSHDLQVFPVGGASRHKWSPIIKIVSVNFAGLGWLSDLPKFDRLSKAINILYTLYFFTVYIKYIHGSWKCMEVVKYHISIKLCAMQRRLLMISKLILMHALTFTPGQHQSREAWAVGGVFYIWWSQPASDKEPY